MLSLSGFIGLNKSEEKRGGKNKNQAADNALDMPEKAWNGFSLLEVETGQSLARHEDSLGFLPASTVKLLTALAAWEAFGGEQRWSTHLYVAPQAKTGSPTLWIRAEGDPLFGSEFAPDSAQPENVLRVFVQSASEYLAKVRTASPNQKPSSESGLGLFSACPEVDESALPTGSPGDGWLYEDIANHYAAVPRALCWRHNRYSLTFHRPAKPGELLRLDQIRPSFSGISEFRIVAVVGPAGSGDSAFLYGSGFQTPRRIGGHLGVDKKPWRIFGALPEPSWTFRKEFANALVEKNLLPKNENCLPAPFPKSDFKGEFERTAFPANAVLLHRIESLPLSALTEMMLLRSDNLIAEQLRALLDQRFARSQKVPSAKTQQRLEPRSGVDSETPRLPIASGLMGYALRADHSAQEMGFPKIDPQEIDIRDGSGLSRLNRISPRALAKILASAAQEKNFSEFLSAFPERGMPGPGIYAKSGSMAGVIAYAGYIRSKSGKLLSFAFFCNQNPENPRDIRLAMKRQMRLWQESH
jgi:D-alanyl-D-alanine carboxypeptidase/D-alanyl-D-alanine-endopeptidase (penicillin-binding protein 4)